MEDHKSLAVEPLSVDEAIQMARSFFNDYPPELENARKVLNQCWSAHPDDPNLLIMFGELACETGNMDESIRFLKRSIELDPTGEPYKYFYLAQLLSGLEAKECFLKCLELVKIELETKANAAPGVFGFYRDSAHLKMELCSCCCSVAELYMTDLCDEEDAEQECLQYIMMAKGYDENSIEASQCLATYMKVIGNLVEAKKEAWLCLDLIEKANSASKQADTSPVLPSGYSKVSIEVRTNLSRTLIDLMETKAAIQLLESCLEEDEQDITVWYVLSCAYLAEDDFKHALAAAEAAEQLLSDSECFSDPDIAIKTDVSSLLNEIRSRMN